MVVSTHDTHDNLLDKRRDLTDGMGSDWRIFREGGCGTSKCSVWAKVKKAKEDEFYRQAARMMEVSSGEIGCITFTYHQNTKDSCDFFLYEQWKDMESVQAHVKDLQKLFGPAEEGEMFPKELLDYWESWTADVFDVVSVD